MENGEMTEQFYDFNLTAFDERGNIRAAIEISGLDVLLSHIDVCLRDPDIKTIGILCYDKEAFLKKYRRPYPLPSSIVFSTDRYAWWGDFFKEFE